MLLVTYSTTSELQVFRLRIDFEHSKINIQNLALLSNCLSFTNDEKSTPPTDSLSTTHGRLTHLEFIPAGPESRTRTRTSPFVLASFSHVSHDFQGNDTVETRVCTWKLDSENVSLHMAFDQLSPAKYDGTNSPDITVNSTCQAHPKPTCADSNRKHSIWRRQRISRYQKLC